MYLYNIAIPARIACPQKKTIGVMSLDHKRRVSDAIEKLPRTLVAVTVQMIQKSGIGC